MKKIRTRFAPSPTGKLHIGGARTALFCYLFAKHSNGEFLLRLEDTDIEREIKEGEKNLLNGLKWLNIEPDFYPGKENVELGKFRQSEKLKIYQNFANKLLESSKAYKCYCEYDSSQILNESNAPCGSIIFDHEGKPRRTERKCLKQQNNDKKHSIRILMPENEIYSWNDGVRNEVKFNSNDIGDWVAIKSNGIATYNFANPIDDIDMKITHVMRGEEHISNTPKQIHIYKLFGWEIPHFTHFTVIIGDDGKKLSKRDEKVLQFVELYEQRGYIPEAVVNYLSLLGWSPKTEQEIFPLTELVKLFTLEGLNKAPSKFDLDKLKWINNFYIKKLSEVEFQKFIAPFLLNSKLEEKIKNEISFLYKDGLREGQEIINHLKIFENENLIYTDDQKEIISNSKDVLSLFQSQISSICDWKAEDILNIIKSIGLTLNKKGRELLLPIRIALSGTEHGPDLSKTIELLGKEKVLKNIGVLNV